MDRRRTIGLLIAAALALASCDSKAQPKSGPQADQRAAAVAAALAEQRALFARAPAPTAADAGTAWQFAFPGLMLDRVPLSAFKGNVVLVVNTASRCGFTPQYEGLQQLYNLDRSRGFTVVGIPSNNFGGQEPGAAAEISAFCEMNFGVTFPMAGKLEVVGGQADPFYKWAQSKLGDAAVPKWNFHKLLIGRDGRLVAAFPSTVTPMSERLRAAVEAELAK